MNIIVREMRASVKSLVLWTVAIIAIIAGGMSKYGGMEEAAGQAMNDLLAAMPKALLAIFGMGDADISTPLGYYSVLFSYLLLMGGIHASMLGANTIAKEERDQTVEFLFSKPVSRVAILTEKIVAGNIQIGIFTAISYILSVAVVSSYAGAKGAGEIIAVMMLGLFLFQLLFFAVGVASAVFSRRPKLATGIATGILLFAYFLSVAIDLSAKLESLIYLTPFKYVDTGQIISGSGLDAKFVILSLALTLGMIVSSYVRYLRKDMNR